LKQRTWRILVLDEVAHPLVEVHDGERVSLQLATLEHARAQPRGEAHVEAENENPPRRVRVRQDARAHRDDLALSAARHALQNLVTTRQLERDLALVDRHLPRRFERQLHLRAAPRARRVTPGVAAANRGVWIEHGTHGAAHLIALRPGEAHAERAA